MLDIPMIEKEIEDLESKHTCYQVCERLAILYSVLDHAGEKTRKLYKFSPMDANKWVSKMENEDGTTGAHWTFDQVHQLMEQRGIDCDPVQFWAALCMMYSGYATAASKHGVGGDVDFYIDMACAFLNDKDAPKDKLARYLRTHRKRIKAAASAPRFFRA